MLAEMYADTDGRARALAAFEAAARASPNEPYPRQRIAQLLDAEGRPDDATAQLERFARGARDPAIHLELARRYWPRTPDKAIAVLDALAARLPDEVSVALSIADLYTQWGRRDLAVVAYRRVVQLDPAYIVVLAIALAATGDRQGIVELARKVSRDAKKLGDLAKVMLDFGMWSEAIDAFTAAIALDPKRAELWSGRAGAREGLEKWDEGAADAERGLLALTSKDPRTRQVARHLFVRLAARSSRRVVYYEAWRLVQAREPSHVDAERIATELATVAAFDAAIVVPGLERIAAALPRDAVVRVDLAARYIELERHDAALAMLREAARLAPADPVLARRIDELRKLRAASMTELAWSRAAWRAPVLVDSVPQRDAIDRPMRWGVRLGTSIGTAPAVTFGAIATRTWGTRSLVTRLDYTEQADLHIGGAGVGMTSRFATPRALFAIGGGTRVEYRAGGAAVPVGLAGELGADLTSRFTPLGLGLRIARFLDGETRAGLELVLELR
jgi:tetratricopeptide (TPR) repeat protein